MKKTRTIYYLLIVILSFGTVVIIDGKSINFLTMIVLSREIGISLALVLIIQVLLAVSVVLYLILFFLNFKSTHYTLEAYALYISVSTTVFAFILLSFAVVLSKDVDYIIGKPVLLKIGISIVGFCLLRIYESYRGWKEEEKEAVQALEVSKKIEKQPKEKTKITKPMRGLVWQIYKKNIVNSLMLLLGAALSCGFTMTVIISYQIFRQMQNSQRMLISDEVTGVLSKSITMIVISAILVLAMALKPYVKARVQDYRTLELLGGRSQVLSRFIAIEYVGTIFVALIAGIFLSKALVYVFQRILLGMFPQVFEIQRISIKTYLLAIGLVLLIFIFSTFVNHEIFIETGMGSSDNTMLRNDNFTGRFTSLYIFLGLGALIVGSFFYRQQFVRESIYAMVFCVAGMAAFIRGLGAKILSIYKNKGEGYFRHLPQVQFIYARYKSQMSNFTLLFFLHIFIIANVVFNIATILPLSYKSDMPYDYIAMGEEKDVSFFNGLEDRYDLQTEVMPMVRVAVSSSSSLNVGYTMNSNFQGQQIGISARAYEEITGKKMELKDKEIAILFQNSRAKTTHLLDFSVLRGSPRVRFGLPEYYMWDERDKVFDSGFIIKKEARETVLGELVDGYQEQVVVFSNEFFEEVRGVATGPKYLALLSQVPEDESLQVHEELEEYSKNHVEYTLYDSIIKPFYSRTDVEYNQFSANSLKLCGYGLVATLLLICVFYTVAVRQLTDYDVQKDNLKQLSILGMKGKSLTRIFKIESISCHALAFLLAMIASAFLIRITMFTRLFSQADIRITRQYGFIILLVYFVLNGMILCIVNMATWRKLRREGLL
ncbi:hypothetical protein M2149_002877 [Lachnospiraceae bacterium PFB1-21]